MSSPPRAIPRRLNLGLLLMASAASAWLLSTASHAESSWAIAAAAAGFALTGNMLFSLLHEGVHRILHPVPAVNEWAARLAGAWFPTGLGIQRAFHLTHHRNNRSREEQFDILREGDIRWLKRAQWYAILTGLYWVVAVVGVLAHLVAPRALRARLLRDGASQTASQTSSRAYLDALDGLSPATSRLEIAFAVAFQVALFLVLDLTLVGWASCYAAFALTWSSLQYADHAFSPLDATAGAWNLGVGPVARIFFLDYHRHLTHHQDPQVPWIHLRRHTDPNAPEPLFWDVWREMWRGPRSAAAARAVGHRLSKQRPARRFFWLPPVAHLRTAVTLSVLVSAWFLLVYGGASALSAHVPWRIRVDLPWEATIPFVPWSAVPYLSMLVLLALAPFVIRRTRELALLAFALAAQTALAAVFFVALPVETTFPERVADGGAAWFFLIADTLNLERNFLPSLHVAFAATAVLAFLPSASRRVGAGLCSWAAAIAASTVFMHEHHLADVVAGLVLAGGTWWLVTRWRIAIDVEWLCLRTFARCARRHRRYALIGAALCVASLPRWRERRVLRTGFAFLQWIDDLLDGDLACDGEPLQHVGRVDDALRRGAFGEGGLDRLAEAFAADLRGVGGDAAMADALDLIDAMKEDRRRVLTRRLSHAADLRTHLRRTFTLSIDLMLVAGRSTVRAVDVPELIEAFGWCSVMRDLDEDLTKGLVNVPQEVLAVSAADPFHLTHDELLRLPAVREWMIAELARAERLLDATALRLDTLDGARGVRVLRMFTRSIRGVARRRLPKRYAFLDNADGATAAEAEERARARSEDDTENLLPRSLDPRVDPATHA